jgi:hypothetical protein
MKDAGVTIENMQPKNILSHHRHNNCIGQYISTVAAVVKNQTNNSQVLEGQVLGE